MIKIKISLASLFVMALVVQADPPIGETICLLHVDEDRYVTQDGTTLVVKTATSVEDALKFAVLDADGDGPGSDILLNLPGTTDYVGVDTDNGDILSILSNPDTANNTLTHFTWTEFDGGITLTSVGVTDGTPVVGEQGAANSLRANRETASSNPDTKFSFSIVESEEHKAAVGLIAFATDSQVELDWTQIVFEWSNNTTGQPNEYKLYRSTSPNVTSADLLLTTSDSTYTDTAVTNGEIYYYAVSASDVESNESDLSAEVWAQPITAAVRDESIDGDKPNIIFFIVDDMDKDDVACYGGEVLTPNLDRLADEGMRMDAGHVVATVCTPSRYSMFTGRYPGNSTWPSYLADFPVDKHGSPEFNVGLEDDNMNVGNVLRLGGYVTGHVGKLHVGAEHETGFSPNDDPNDSAVIAKWKAHELSIRRWIVDRGFSWAKNVYAGNTENPYNKHNPEWTLEAALEFIELNQDRPFYLHYCTTMMHGGSKNWNAALDYPLYSGAGLLDEAPDPEFRSSIPGLVEAAGFSDETKGFTWMDATLGAMLDKLKDLEIDDNTLFVFVTDHGTGGKFSLNEKNGTSIPFIVRWPDVVPAESVCTNLVQNTDMVPTFFEVAGVTEPEGYHIDGTSIVPILSDPTAKVHDHLYFEMGYGRAVRTDKWKYIAVRHGSDRFAEIQAAKRLNMPQKLAYVGNMKRVTGLLRERPNGYDLDQLYNLENNTDEDDNLAYNSDPDIQAKLTEMKGILTTYLVAQGRPFGEFVDGNDSVDVDDVQPYVDQLKLLKAKDDDKGFEYRYSAKGTPYHWLYDQGLIGDDYEAIDQLDTDGDGFTSWQEYIAGTDPLQSSSGWAVELDVTSSGGDYVIRWPSVEGRTYKLQKSNRLSDGFNVLDSNIVGTGGEISYTVEVEGAAFFCVEVEVEPE